jgi:hypothetical protein
MRVKIALAASSTALVISFGAIGYSVTQNAERVNDVDELAATQLSERIDNTRRACEQQNADNLRVRKELRRLTLNQARKQGQKPVLTQEQKQTIADLADAIHQPRDCEDVVRRSTGRSQAKK